MITLAARLQLLLAEIIGTALILGTSGEVNTSVHYASRSGMLHINVFPQDASPDQCRNRITLLATEGWDTYHKLKTVDAYLRSVLRHGYHRFTGFQPPQRLPDPLPVTSPSVAGHGQPGVKRLLTRAQSGEANPYQKVRPG